jgi:hypothetical protein
MHQRGMKIMNTLIDILKNVLELVSPSCNWKNSLRNRDLCFFSLFCSQDGSSIETVILVSPKFGLSQISPLQNTMVSQLLNANISFQVVQMAFIVLEHDHSAAFRVSP